MPVVSILQSVLSDGVLATEDAKELGLDKRDESDGWTDRAGRLGKAVGAHLFRQPSREADEVFVSLNAEEYDIQERLGAFTVDGQVGAWIRAHRWKGLVMALGRLGCRCVAQADGCLGSSAFTRAGCG